jgi:hypothetical protein
MRSYRRTPAAWSMASQFDNACRVPPRIVSPTQLPVLGSMPTARDEHVRSCMDSQAVEGRTPSARGRDDPRCHVGPPGLPATFPTEPSQVSIPSAAISQPHTDSIVDHCNLRVEELQHRPSDLPPFTKSPRVPVGSSATPQRCRRSTRRRSRSRL